MRLPKHAHATLEAHAKDDADLAQALSEYTAHPTLEAREELSNATRRVLQRLVYRLDEAAFDNAFDRAGLAREIEDVARALALIANTLPGCDTRETMQRSMVREPEQWSKLFEFAALAGDGELAQEVIGAMRHDVQAFESAHADAWLYLLRSLLRESTSCVRNELDREEHSPRSVRGVLEDLERIGGLIEFCKDKLATMTTALIEDGAV